jgi:hypothetical protein
MDLTDVVHQFEIWNEGVQRAIFNSPEFKTILNADLIEYEMEGPKAKVAKKYAYLALDDKYKTEDFCIDNVQTPHECFKENAILPLEPSDLPFEPDKNDSILPF